MKFLARTVIFFFLLAMSMNPFAHADSFEIMTEEYPPFNYTENGRLTGLVTEVMEEMLKRLNIPSKMEVMSWSRAYHLIQNNDGKILFSMTRTEQREPLFKWVGPVASNKWVLFSKKGKGIKINSLEDARKVSRIGTYKDDAAELFLTEQNFTNLVSVINDSQNLLKLMSDRIDLWIVGELQGLHKAKIEGIDPASLEKVFEVKETQLFIAFSKNTPDSVVAQWQKVLNEIKADGTYDKIMVKYL